jgi:hypothetical protein
MVAVDAAIGIVIVDRDQVLLVGRQTAALGHAPGPNRRRVVAGWAGWRYLDLGFVPRGEAGAFVATHNTNGGGLSYMRDRAYHGDSSFRTTSRATASGLSWSPYGSDGR